METVVIGGGLAGLSAGAMAAKAGAEVIVLDGSGQLGGRARSTVVDGPRGPHILNLGPHALYQGGPATAVLDRVGVARPGSEPVVGDYVADADGRLVPLPVTPGALLRSKALTRRGRFQVIKLLAGLKTHAADALLDTVAWGDWVAEMAPDPTAQRMLRAVGRLSSYAADTAVSARTVLAQMQLARVEYLDGGWQGLIDRLAAAATRHGATIRSGTAARAVVPAGDRWVVETDQGPLPADGVIVAGLAPAAVAGLLGDVAGEALRDRLAATVPVRAAVLDLALDRLPNPERPSLLGFDEPTYLATHSLVADLAPEGAAVIHVARYLPTGEDGKGARDQLEGLMDRLQPGWRDHLRKARFLPSLSVVHDLAPASMGGLSGRTPVRVAPGLALAGDWVGPRGWLADAALASAEEAVSAIMGEDAQGSGPGEDAIGSGAGEDARVTTGAGGRSRA